MTGARIGLGLWAVCLFAGIAPAQLAGRTYAGRPTAPASVGSPAFLDTVDSKFKADAAAVVAKPTLTAKHVEEPFVANPTVYKWLLEHPDRTALAWERIGVPCLPIKEKSAGVFHYQDANGSDVAWQAVGAVPDGRVWYAIGKVKPGALMPTVPVKAVAVVTYPTLTKPDGKMVLTPIVQVYFQTDSRAAATVLRIAGPAAPRMAEDGAEQLLFFFSGMARYLEKHPDQTAALLTPAKVMKAN